MPRSSPPVAQLSTEDFVASPEDTDGVITVAPPGPDPRKHVVLQIVKSHPDGVTGADIAAALSLSHPTAMRLLRELEREREIYSRQLRSIQVWYPNGRMVHPHLQAVRELRGKTYRATVQEGRAGPLVQVQERSYSLLHGERVDGAIFIDYAALDDFIQLLRELAERYERFEENKEKA
jgi:DNA-binding transcriptional ArsR family regulator